MAMTCALFDSRIGVDRFSDATERAAVLPAVTFRRALDEWRELVCDENTEWFPDRRGRDDRVAAPLYLRRAFGRRRISSSEAPLQPPGAVLARALSWAVSFIVAHRAGAS